MRFASNNQSNSKVLVKNSHVWAVHSLSDQSTASMWSSGGTWRRWVYKPFLLAFCLYWENSCVSDWLCLFTRSLGMPQMWQETKCLCWGENSDHRLTYNWVRSLTKGFLPVLYPGRGTISKSVTAQKTFYISSHSELGLRTLEDEEETKSSLLIRSRFYYQNPSAGAKLPSKAVEDQEASTQERRRVPGWTQGRLVVQMFHIQSEDICLK